MTLTHQQWMDLSAEEYQRITAILADLPDGRWATPTDCTGWTVRDIVAHLAGAAAATASVREQLRQQRIGAKQRGDRFQIDAVNDLQIRERSELSNAQLRDQLTELADRSIRARRRTPGFVRALRLTFPAPVGHASIGFLNDVVYTRDAWMHRIDICRAIGLPIELTADHDGQIIADAARAWMTATLNPGITLTGTIGQTHGAPPAGAPAFDAIEFTRALSGRGTLPGIAHDVVLF